MAHSETVVAKAIETTFLVRAISMCFDREEHKDGKWIKKTYPLFWGYVFVYTNEPLVIRDILNIEHVNRILQYGDGESNLQGDDRKFAEWVLKFDGHIGLSKALLVGDRTCIIEGPLKEYEGTIKKVNRQKGKALVDVRIGETIKPIWLYFEWMVQKQGKLVRLRGDTAAYS